MEQLHQEMVFCKQCNRNTLFQGNVPKINWLMHIALMFIGIGFITLPLAILNGALNTRIGGKRGLYCSVCGTQV